MSSGTAGRLVETLARDLGVRPGEVRVVRAPYRFCPIGAHLDHQDGCVTGFALDRALYLAYVPLEDDEIRLTSERAGTEVRFRTSDVPPPVRGDWGNYARGAVIALSRRERLGRGLAGRIAGEMEPGGVSTSAALGVACLLALEDVNDRVVSTEENVALDREIENGYLGLANGILDQSVILRARRGALLHLDCRSGAAETVPAPAGIDEPVLIAVYSGLDAPLIATNYNTRVEECRRAARMLFRMSGQDPPRSAVLRDVAEDVITAKLDTLPLPERSRVRHFVTESAHVRRGVEAWRAGQLERFGEILTATGVSSIESYECGAPELIRLFEILRETPGVLGTRFSGAGFRGYVMAMAGAEAADGIGERVQDAYRLAYPEHARRVHVHVCRTSDPAGRFTP